ncbi:HEAT repeat domain-containing protein [Actinomadura geliboluensis]|uniref:HEAT repeat domain-containing protein n=1 Tax=Actinomadura geliboluensis TaxID=882440 RepID=UPI0026174634|nr:HEAT repeat domain-containing protein [Actinomadura geliboluensis]
MEIQALIEQLAGPDHKSASDALVQLGAPAVRPVLDVLCDEDSPVEWSTSATVLRNIGRPSLDPLLEAIAAAPTTEVARRCGWALCGLKLDDLSALVPGLRHPSPTVRADVAYTLQLKGEAALPYAPDLIALLDDPDADVRQRIIWALQGIGPEVLPLLRDVRRSSTAGRRRVPALQAIAAIAGPSAMEARDQTLIRRLIRIKLANETPEPMHLCGAWYAVPTTDQKAVLEAFGLSDPEPVTMRLGQSAWTNDTHADAEHGGCSRVYVSPAFDGWTLVFGHHSEDAHLISGLGDDGNEDEDDEAFRDIVLARCRSLSDHFGTVHWYGVSGGDGWTSWCIAEKGEIVRYYDSEEPEEQFGSLAAEEGHHLPDLEEFGDDDLPEDLETADATTIAEQLSVNPEALGPHTRVEGHGVLALTACGRAHGHPQGALEI